jgi:hypothetical protein
MPHLQVHLYTGWNVGKSRTMMAFVAGIFVWMTGLCTPLSDCNCKCSTHSQTHDKHKKLAPRQSCGSHKATQLTTMENERGKTGAWIGVVGLLGGILPGIMLTGMGASPSHPSRGLLIAGIVLLVLGTACLTGTCVAAYIADREVPELPLAVPVVPLAVPVVPRAVPVVPRAAPAPPRVNPEVALVVAVPVPVAPPQLVVINHGIMELKISGDAPRVINYGIMKLNSNSNSSGLVLGDIRVTKPRPVMHHDVIFMTNVVYKEDYCRSSSRSSDCSEA